MWSALGSPFPISFSCLPASGTALLLTAGHFCEGLENFIFLVVPNRSQVDDELVHFDPAKNGRMTVTEHFLQLRGAEPTVPDRYQRSSERLVRSRSAPDYGFAIAEERGEARLAEIRFASRSARAAISCWERLIMRKAGMEFKRPCK